MGVTGDFKGLDDLRARVAKIATPSGRHAITRNLADEASKLLSDEFKQSHDPYGNPWAPLTSRTGNPLLDTGTNLRDSLGPVSTPEGFTVSTAFIGAPVHQYGATIRPKHAKALAFRTRGKPSKSNPRGKVSDLVFAGEVTIPRRQFMPEGDVGPIWKKGLEDAADDAMRDLLGMT